MYYNWACDKEVAKYLIWTEHCNINKTNMVVTLWEKERNYMEQIKAIKSIGNNLKERKKKHNSS